MSNVIKTATNKFTKGLIMDFSPENTSNEVLSHALNATLLTFNGNEMSLQNDMGNARVETAYLPEGYMPVGTCEYGGIIYIVSYNPLEDKSQIGCFPSPERNVSNEELGLSAAPIQASNFQELIDGKPTGKLTNLTYTVNLRNDNLNPGDKFIVSSTTSIYDEKLLNLQYQTDNGLMLVEHPIISLNIVSIEDSGRITYLNSDLRQYEKNDYSYYIIGEDPDTEGTTQKIDIDSYRNVLSSGYNVFKSKISGKLAILAELITIDSYSVTHKIKPKIINNKEIDGDYNLEIYTDVEPKISNILDFNKYPKLKYYYLQKSLGYFEHPDKGTICMYNDDTNTYNGLFFDTSLSDILDTTNCSEEIIKACTGSFRDSFLFNFPRKESYHGRMGEIKYDENKDNIYAKIQANTYYRFHKNQIKSNSFWDNYNIISYYIYNPDGDYTKLENRLELNPETTYYVKVNKNVYKDVNRDTAYKNELTLYKYEAILYEAGEVEISNTNLEKFVYKKTTYYELINGMPNLNDSYTGPNESKIVVYKEGNEWKTETQLSEDKTYYWEISKSVPESLGYQISDPSLIQGKIYYAGSSQYIPAIAEERKLYFDFETNPLDSSRPYFGAPFPLYYYDSDTKPTYEIASEAELNNVYIDLYLIAKYSNVSLSDIRYDSVNTTYYLKSKIDQYLSKDEFNFSREYNKLYNDEENLNEEEKSIHFYEISDYIPYYDTNNNYHGYEDIILANLQLPKILTDNLLGLKFKYDYTLVPCMNYGRLDHLAVSNTVNFEKLFSFNSSCFDTWKYRIDGDLLTLTFGTKVYDDFLEDKVDAIILEFYDLWGFAGSLEISNKKSYSGIFTKVISLNTLGALSTSKIDVINNNYTRNYVHNIQIKNILRKDNNKDILVPHYNAKDVEHSDNGWVYKGTTSSIEENDCGTLYKNLIYGVKPYFRRTIKNSKNEEPQYEFIEKDSMFLFTLPIWNDKYYNTQNFHTDLLNPSLDLILSYKLVDRGSKNAYTNEDAKIVNGYYTEAPEGEVSDSDNIIKYLSGTYNKTDLKLVKHYRYIGTSNLYLKIGLMAEYSQNFGMKFVEDMNNYFGCTVKLLTEVDGKTVTANSPYKETIDDVSFLQYKNNDLINLNSLLINDASEFVINNGSFQLYNFSETKNGKAIPITYNFIVGYYANIRNIRETIIPATTVCALCHKLDDNTYNYEDFNIYEVTDEDQNKVLYSSVMYYNEGTVDTEIFGICRLVEHKHPGKVDVKWLWAIPTNTISTKATSIILAGQLNTEALKSVSSNIGKLAFCTPHAHCITKETYGVNIYGTNWSGYDFNGDEFSKLQNEGKFNGSGSELVITNFKEKDHYNGISASDIFNSWPSVNMVLNTKKSLLYYGEFISTINGSAIKLPQRTWNQKGEDTTPTEYDSIDDLTLNREFSGLNPSKLTEFNRKLMQTMKGIYAYNPDYDSLNVNVGDVYLEDKLVSFNSNIVSYNASLLIPTDKCFNDFIALGDVTITLYLNSLHEHSKINVYENSKFLPQISFKENLRYCGGSDHYLISSLTYNTPIPEKFSNELYFQNSNIITIKHEDGTNTSLIGKLNKKALYAYVNNKLILLDVSNYYIDDEGKLYIKYQLDFYTSGIKNEKLSTSDSSSGEDFTFSGGLVWDVPTVNFNGSFTTVPGSVELYILDENMLLARIYDTINATPQTKQYSQITQYKDYCGYEILSKYKNATFKGTSITINDLEYEPELEGHRLFIKKLNSNYLKLDNVPRSILFYRDTKVQDSWTATDPNQNQNHIYLYVGPSFMPSN